MKLDRGANILASNRMIEEPWLEQIISLTFNMNCMTESFAIFSRSFTRLFPIFFFQFSVFLFIKIEISFKNSCQLQPSS